MVEAHWDGIMAWQRRITNGLLEEMTSSLRGVQLTGPDSGRGQGFSADWFALPEVERCATARCRTDTVAWTVWHA